MNKALKDAGFGVLDPTLNPRLILALGGKEKFGKTHFAFTAPGLIAFFNLDMGDEGVVSKFFGQKDILSYDVEVPRIEPGVDASKISDKAKEIWAEFQEAYAVALKEARTVIIDTATELWELVRIARFGKLIQVQPYQYGPVNAEFRGVIRQAYKAVGTNVIFLHKMKPIYINDKRTRDMERAGFSDTGYLVQVNATMNRLDPDGEERKKPIFSITVNDCRQDANLIGTTLVGPICNFPTLAQMILPQTKEEDWT